MYVDVQTQTPVPGSRPLTVDGRVDAKTRLETRDSPFFFFFLIFFLSFFLLSFSPDRSGLT